MFIPQVDPENEYREELVSLYKSRFVMGVDVITPKRSIIIYKDLDINRSNYEGFHNIKTSIINISILEGRYHHDTIYNPDLILAKTTYNGYMRTPMDAIESEFKLSETLISKSNFTINNAYTSYVGLWSVDNEFECTPIGVSILDMVDLRSATMNTRNHVTIYGGEMSIKLEISFDNDTFYSVLPLPLPYYYSRLHSEINHDEPIITGSSRISIEDICDEYTKLNLIDFGNSPDITKSNRDYRYESDSTASINYLCESGKEIVNREGAMPMEIACHMHRSLCENLFSQIFKFFTRYQLSSIDFIYDSKRNVFNIPSMHFSYDTTPKNYAIKVINELITDSNTLNHLNEFKIMYDNIRIYGRLTDLKYDLLVVFEKGHKDVKELKSIKYRCSVFDLMNCLTTFQTSVVNPITSI